VLDDTRLNGRVDALVNSYLAEGGTDTASKRKQLAKAFSERATRNNGERTHPRPNRAGRRLGCGAKCGGSASHDVRPNWKERPRRGLWQHHWGLFRGRLHIQIDENETDTNDRDQNNS
jgi:hypothetical protein